MADPLVSNQGINIAGHKVPFALVMAGAAVVTVFLIMKSKSGAQVAIGPQPAASTTVPSLDQLAVGSPQEAQFANLTQQIASIQGALTPAPTPTTSLIVGHNTGSAWTDFPIYQPGNYAQEGTVPAGTVFNPTGPEIFRDWIGPAGHYQAGFYPVTYQGTPGFLSAADITGQTLAQTPVGHLLA